MTDLATTYSITLQNGEQLPRFIKYIPFLQRFDIYTNDAAVTGSYTIMIKSTSVINDLNINPYICITTLKVNVMTPDDYHSYDSLLYLITSVRVDTISFFSFSNFKTNYAIISYIP